MKLTRERYMKGCEFIKKNARPLDQALYRYHFEDGPKEDVIIELVAYQNLDGGFGNGIEPDFRLRSSSPMATFVGLQYYITADGDSNSDMVKAAIEYLVSTYNSEENYWPSTFANVNNEPHAPWWYVEKIAPPTTENWANPSAEIAGYLNKYSRFVPRDFLARINQRVIEVIESQELITGFLYNFLCWNRVYTYFPKSISSIIQSKLMSTIQDIAPTFEEKMGEIRIFWFLEDKNSLLLSNSDLVYFLLEKEIERQADDGGWWPTWKWGQYEDIWPIAEKEWAGRMTFECLRTLRNLNLNDSLIEALE
ncbi:MAG: hypothetical protein P1Q69_05080 [Candidatus Thorarchaeota archaeon]|nr:hypothetical protein [Candidatus Thorarchaeota archaeon]